MAVLAAVRARLAEQAVACEELEIAEGCRLVVTARGGCVLGPFWGEDGESLLRAAVSFESPEAFERSVARAGWDLGGERVRIAVEGPEKPHAADSTAHHLSARGAGVRVRQDLVLDAGNASTGRKHLSLERTIRPCADPLRSRRDGRALSRGTRYAGYEEEVTLLEASRDSVASQARVIARLSAGATLVVPTLGEVELRDTFEPAGPDRQSVEPGCVRLRLTGERRFGLGYRAACIWGRMGYLTPRQGGHGGAR